MGVSVCFVEYRGYGRSTGTPALAAMRGDGESVVRALGVDPGQVVAFGRSLGSLYAVELANRLPGIAGVVIESGIANLGENWVVRDAFAHLGQSKERLAQELKSEFDIQQKLEGYQGALLVLHAEHDQFLGRSHAERLHAWGGGTDKRLVIFPSGDHNTILFANFQEYRRELTEFLT
jgi:pimeloyl-ACP methyl ester carboxylesterase